MEVERDVEFREKHVDECKTIGKLLMAKYKSRKTYYVLVILKDHRE